MHTSGASPQPQTAWLALFQSNAMQACLLPGPYQFWMRQHAKVVYRMIGHAGHIWRQIIDTAEAVPLDAMSSRHEFPSLLEHNQYHIQARATIALLSELVK